MSVLLWRLAGIGRVAAVTAVSAALVFLVRAPVQVLGRDAGIAFVVWPLVPIVAAIAAATAAAELPHELLRSRPWRGWKLRLFGVGLSLAAGVVLAVVLAAGCAISGCAPEVAEVGSTVVVRNSLLATGLVFGIRRPEVGHVVVLAAIGLWGAASWLFGIPPVGGDPATWALWLQVAPGAGGYNLAWILAVASMVLAVAPPLRRRSTAESAAEASNV